ncbi:MAG TPA: HAD family phosphatase [bacterium]
MTARWRLILFDMGGVVIDCETDRLIHQAAQLLGRSFDDVARAVYDPVLLRAFEVGSISPEGYYDGLKRALGIGWTYTQFVRIWNDMLRERPIVPEIIRRLHGRYRLAALTNTNVLHLAHLKTGFEALRLLDDWIASCEVGACKPEPKIYQAALERAGVGPEEAVYVDDRPELVDAGRRLGLTAIRCESPAQLEADFIKLGLLP